MFKAAARVFTLLAILGVCMTTSEGAEKAPETYRVKVETSKGNFVLEVKRASAPVGADRFYELVKKEFYKEGRFFRVVPGFVVQWGINGDPKVQADWRENTIKDDPVVESNVRGSIVYATSGPNSRTTQLFINFADNSRLDGMGFAPFGKVVEGMDVVDKINDEYGQQPDQGRIQQKGNEYLNAAFPNLDYIKSMKIVEDK